MTEIKPKEMRVILVSGFLGAGKTTFIRNMIARTGKTFCVIENEYAGSDVDKSMIEGDNDEIKVWEMTEGCICCTMKNSLPNKIMNILSLYGPDYLIIEATGIGYLSRIIENVRTVEHSRVRLMRTITIVSADSVETMRYQDDALYKDQIQNGQMIVLSKCESWGTEERRQAEQYIRSLNPNAKIVTTPYANAKKEWWDALLAKYFDGGIITTEEEEIWDRLTLCDVRLSGLGDIFRLMEDIVNGRLGQIARVKGFVKAGEQWVQCDISGERYAVAGISAQQRSNMVFIGKSLNKAGIQERFLREKPVRIRYSSKKIAG